MFFKSYFCFISLNLSATILYIYIYRIHQRKFNIDIFQQSKFYQIPRAKVTLVSIQVIPLNVHLTNVPILAVGPLFYILQRQLWKRERKREDYVGKGLCTCTGRHSSQNSRSRGISRGRRTKLPRGRRTFDVGRTPEGL